MKLARNKRNQLAMGATSVVSKTKQDWRMKTLLMLMHTVSKDAKAPEKSTTRIENSSRAQLATNAVADDTKKTKKETVNNETTNQQEEAQLKAQND